MRRYRAILCSFLLITMLGGCAMFARSPLDVLIYANAGETEASQRLFVFMRGMGGSHRSFEQEGLVADVRDRKLPFDMAAPNAHLGYYTSRTLIQRLKTDVIDPARQKGYEEIWLIGFSMGGLGSMLYLMEHPEDITGICLIAPFVGYRSIINEIEAAGGVRKWDPGTYEAGKDWPRMLWEWIKTSVADQPAKKVYLGYGSEDYYVNGHHLLAQVLPPERVYAIDGGHDYPTFITLWHMFLDNGSYIEVDYAEAHLTDFQQGEAAALPTQ
jgi:pimeloyl-ACP methyl ester carboxylesterase